VHVVRTAPEALAQIERLIEEEQEVGRSAVTFVPSGRRPGATHPVALLARAARGHTPSRSASCSTSVRRSRRRTA